MLKGVISYWVLPLFAAGTWFGTLLAMMIVWLSQGQPVYPWDNDGQRIAYISDIGASGVQPLFIAGSTVAVVVFDVAFVSERWLRHKGRLAHNTSRAQKVLSICASIAAIIGALGLILLSIFNCNKYPHAHDALLCVFIAGYIISAIFICAEYQRLGYHFREYRVLRASFWTKLAFIILEIALVIAFGVESYLEHYNRAAILEWTISLIYIFYLASFVMDFLPAVHTKHHRFPSITEMGHPDVNGPSVSGGPVYTEPLTDISVHGSNGSHASNTPMTQTGRYVPPPLETNVAASRNF